jgi:hypothetical protein
MANADFYAVACSDEYKQSATIEDVLMASGGAFTIQDQPARYRVQFGSYGASSWTRERIIGTGGGVIPNGATGIQFRNATKGLVSTVTAVFALRDEPLLSLTFPAAETVSAIEGNINSDGSIASGTGFTVTKGAAGIYTVNFTVAFSVAPVVVATASGSARVMSLQSPATVGQVILEQRSVLGGAFGDGSFGFYAIIPA